MSDHLSAADAARYLACSESLIRSRIASGALDAEKVLGKWQIRREDLDRQPRAHESSRPDRNAATPQGRKTAQAQDRNAATPQARDAARPQDRNAATDVREWRDDLMAQVEDQRDRAERAEHAMDAMRKDYEARIADLRLESVQRVEASKARQIDLERELTVRDSTIVDLRRQVAEQEAEMKTVLSKGQDDALQLANRIADLVEREQAAQTRVYELEPVADQVPMLQAAVEEKDADLSERERELGAMRRDIEAIASRPVTGPVFRLLTKGKLRR